MNEFGKVEKVIDMPKCERCGSVMKPYVLLWDEQINEDQYRTDSVRNFTKIADCLIVVGTGMETEKGQRIVNSLLRRDIPVIEINTESVIKKGNNIQLKMKPEVGLPLLFKEYYKLLAPAPAPKPTD